MFAHQVHSTWEVFAPAKLNVCLNVLGSRADGFHNLESLLVPVQLYDHLSWSAASTPDSPCTLELASADRTGEKLSSADDNLVLVAAKRLADAAGIEPRGTFRLVKRIPQQAGMGGGSSDAAATLVLANAAWEIGYSRECLAKIAADVGSDVPFFLADGPARCRGRGEIVEPTAGLPPLHFVVVKPPGGLPTAEVFGHWKQHQTEHAEQSASVDSLLANLRQGKLRDAGRGMLNQLQNSASRLMPTITDLLREIESLNPVTCLMTGSGSACFGVARSAVQARQMARRLSGMVEGQVFAVSSC